MSPCLSEIFPKGQALKACWPCQVVQALIEIHTKVRKTEEEIRTYESPPQSSGLWRDLVQTLIEGTQHTLTRIRIFSKSQTLKACWPCHVVQALTKAPTKNQAWKACWPCQVVQALIESHTKVRKTEEEIRTYESPPQSSGLWRDLVQTLIEGTQHTLTRIRIFSKSQTLKACWPCHVVQALTKAPTKSQALKACWPCQVVQALIKVASQS